MVQISVLLTTYRRPQLLAQTLRAMARMATTGLTWELLVVDNAGEQTTRWICKMFSTRLPLRYLVCTRPGQNAARNHGLKDVRGEFVLLMDDDGLPDEGWLQEMYRGTQRWRRFKMNTRSRRVISRGCFVIRARGRGTWGRPNLCSNARP